MFPIVSCSLGLQFHWCNQGRPEICTEVASSLRSSSGWLDVARGVAGAGAGSVMAGDQRHHRGGVPHQPLALQ